MTEKLKFVLRMTENIVGKGENAGYQQFLLFPHCFQKASFARSLQLRIVWQRVKLLLIKLRYRGEFDSADLSALLTLSMQICKQL